MHPSTDGPRLPLEAEQHYSIDPPGFVWNATVKVGPLPMLRGRDSYLEGHGHMDIRAGALVHIVDETGDETDQASLLRYLSEMIWFPMAFLGPNVSWEPIDEHSARISLVDRERTATGTMSSMMRAPGRLRRSATPVRRRRQQLSTWSTDRVRRTGRSASARSRQAVWKLPRATSSTSTSSSRTSASTRRSGERAVMRRTGMAIAALGALAIAAVVLWSRDRRAGTHFVTGGQPVLSARRPQRIGTLEHVGRRSGTGLRPVHPVLSGDESGSWRRSGCSREWARNVLAAGHHRVQLHEVLSSWPRLVPADSRDPRGRRCALGGSASCLRLVTARQAGHLDRRWLTPVA
jgi:hypothetical protein